MYATERLIGLASALIDSAEKRRIKLRLLGGLAFYLQAAAAREVAAFQRNYKDLDFAAALSGRADLAHVFTELGWTEDKEFNILHGDRRMLFYYGENLDLQVDVFVNTFEQCHNMNFKNRLAADPLTLPLSDLLLTKLQIHQLNKKDVTDTLMMLYDHDFGLEKPDEKSELEHIVDLTGGDWGWYTTVTDNLAAIREHLAEYISGTDADRLEKRLEWLENNIADAPKTLKWKTRALLGRRVTWFELPEEVSSQNAGMGNEV